MKIIGNIDPGFKDLHIIIYTVFLLIILRDSYVSIVLRSRYLSRIIMRDDFLITNYKKQEDAQLASTPNCGHQISW